MMDKIVTAVKTEAKQPKFFFQLYFIFIVLILACQLAMGKSESYESITLGMNATEKYEILDANICEMVFRISKENPDGFMIQNYQREADLTKSDARIYIAFLDDTTKKLIQQVEIDPWAETNDIYIKFDKLISVGTKVRVRLWSKGFEKKCPEIALSEENTPGTLLWINGELVEGSLGASLYYKKITYSWLKPIIYFVGELLIGIILLLAYRRLKLPLYIRRPGEKIKRRIIKRKSVVVIGFIAILTTSVGLMEYVYSSAIKPQIKLKEYRLINDGTEENIQDVVIEEGDEFTQIFCAGEKNLSGIGIWIEPGSAKKGVLNCRLYEYATGNLVAENRYQISGLKKMSSHVPKRVKTDENKEMLRGYRVLAFPEILRDSNQQTYRLVINLDKTDGGNIVLRASEAETFSLQINNKNANVTLNMAALYSNNTFLKAMFCCMAILITILLCAGYLWVSFYTVSVSKIYLISALILGFIYSFLIPSYYVPDEGAHTAAVYSISNQMLGITEIPGPNRIYKRTCDVNISGEEMQDQYGSMYDDLFARAEDETLQAVRSSSPISNVTMLHYFPAALGFTFARLMHFDHFFMHLLGRLFNMVTMAYLLYVAIRKIPFGKSAIAVLGLLPMTLQQVSSVSYDGLIIAAAYVFTAYAIHLIWEKDISIVDIAITIYSGYVLLASKAGVYIPLLGILLLIPYMKKIDRKKWIVGTVLTLGTLALMFVAQFSSRILSIVGKSQATVFLGGTSTNLYTLTYFINNPKTLVRIFQNTFWKRADYYLRGTLGSPLGLLTVDIPWFILIAFLILLLICGAKESEEKDNFNALTRIYIGFLCVASVILILFSLLITWTEVGEKAIQGIQGRYFLPLMGVGLIIFRTDNLIFKNKREDCLVYTANILNLLAISASLLSIF